MINLLYQQVLSDLMAGRWDAKTTSSTACSAPKRWRILSSFWHKYFVWRLGFQKSHSMPLSNSNERPWRLTRYYFLTNIILIERDTTTAPGFEWYNFFLPHHIQAPLQNKEYISSNDCIFNERICSHSDSFADWDISVFTSWSTSCFLHITFRGGKNLRLTDLTRQRTGLYLSYFSYRFF